MISYEAYMPIQLTSTVHDIQIGWRNDPEIWKWCRQYTLIGPRQQEKWLESIEDDPSIKMFGIYYYPGNFIGTCGFTSIDKHNQNAEFSLFLAPKHQGKGYGEKALCTLFEHGFRDHNFHRIWGETFDGNPASEMFEKCGLKFEGTLRDSYYRNGEFIDSHIYSSIRKEWFDKKGLI